MVDMRNDNKRKKRNEKMIAPIIITVLFLTYLIIYGVLLMKASEWNGMLLLFAIPLAMLAAGMVVVLLARIREIRSGEEDDLDNY